MPKFTISFIILLCSFSVIEFSNRQFILQDAPELECLELKCLFEAHQAGKCRLVDLRNCSNIKYLYGDFVHLIKLVVEDCISLVELEAGQMPNLKVLHASGFNGTFYGTFAYLETLFLDSANVSKLNACQFPALKDLTLDSSEINLLDGVFTSVTCLDVSACVWLQGAHFLQFPNLECLKISSNMLDWLKEQKHYLPSSLKTIKYLSDGSSFEPYGWQSIDFSHFN